MYVYIDIGVPECPNYGLNRLLFDGLGRADARSLARSNAFADDGDEDDVDDD